LVVPLRVASFASHGRTLLRAAAALAALYGNDAAEALYPIAYTDRSGAKLDGDKNRYSITFPDGQLPPVNAFWSVTMYDARTQLLVANPIDRYLINSPMLPNLKKNADGSLTIYVQKDSPGKEREVNWLCFLCLCSGWKKPGLQVQSRTVAPLGDRHRSVPTACENG
jgi:hypothetical protein